MARKAIKRAISLYQRFTGHEAKFIDRYQIPQHTVLMKIGELEGVIYTAKRDGVTEKYLHEFSGRRKPILACSADGKQLYVLGGSYSMTEDGIVG